RRRHEPPARSGGSEMTPIRELLTRAVGLLRRRRRNDLDDELRLHREMLERDLRRRGLSPEAAAREARVALGNAVSIRESYADQQTVPWVESLLQDVRFGARMLRRTPGFTT